MVLTHEADLQTTLEQCAQAIVQHLDVAFSRIWMLDPTTGGLELLASGGLPRKPGGQHRCVRLGQLEVSRIAEQRRPHRTTDVVLISPDDDLAELRPELRVLCMSGYSDDSVVRHGVVRADIALLQKPFTSASLTRKVRDVLDAPRVLSELPWPR